MRDLALERQISHIKKEQFHSAEGLCSKAYLLNWK